MLVNPSVITHSSSSLAPQNMETNVNPYAHIQTPHNDAFKLARYEWDYCRHMAGFNMNEFVGLAVAAHKESLEIVRTSEDQSVVDMFSDCDIPQLMDYVGQTELFYSLLNKSEQ